MIYYKISNEYKKFAEEKAKCTDCKIYEHYQTIVQSEGNLKNPTFMFLGEAAGKVEVQQRRPMVGPAGQELRICLRNFSFNKSNTVITNVIPCRPLNNKFPSNWDLISSCYKKWLFREIEILKPKIIVTCGGPALHAVNNQTAVGINRGKWKFNYKFKAWTLATWHPSYVLRCKNDPERQNIGIQFKDDLQKVSTEWQFIYSDKRLHMDNEQYKETVTKEFKLQHKLMMLMADYGVIY